MSKQTIATTQDVVDAIGGDQTVAKLLNAHPKAVANWRYFGNFPANTYLVLQEALRQKGLHAPDTLWTMRAKAK